jgi:hypothetical protein
MLARIQPTALVTSLFAMFDLQMFLLKILAVVGGAAIGFFGAGWFLNLVGRAFLRRKGQLPAFKIGRYLGMIGLGVLVYLWAFGAGGGGFGGVGGWWPFGGKGATGTDPALSGGASEKPVAQPIEEKATPANTIQVRFLGGKEVVDQRFYLLDQEKQARTWEELVAELKKRKQKDRRLKIIEIVLYQGSIDRDNPAVTKLEDWARKNQLASKLIIHGVDPR